MCVDLSVTLPLPVLFALLPVVVKTSPGNSTVEGVCLSYIIAPKGVCCLNTPPGTNFGADFPTNKRGTPHAQRKMLDFFSLSIDASLGVFFCS